MTDNASNTKKALRDANLSGFGCFAHSLQLIVNDGVISQRVVIDVLAVARSIVCHFKRSTLAYHLLDEIRERLDIPKHKLQHDGTQHCLCSIQYMNKNGTSCICH